MDSRDKASSQQQAGWRWMRQSLQGLRPKVCVHYREEVFDDIRSTLTAETLQRFLDGCFGKLMHFVGGTARSSKAFLHDLLSREISLAGAREDELWFRIGGTNIRFAPPEYALVTGLCFGSSSFDPVESHKLLPDWVRRRFCSGLPISIGKLWERFKTRELVRGPADEYLKVAHVLALYLMGLGYEPETNVENWVWVLVDDLEMWNKFPWGAYTYQALMHCANMLPRKSTRIGKKYQFYGPVWALEIWAYEAIPGWGRANTKLTIPRCLKWSSPHKRHASFFERKIVCSMILEATDEEKLQAYWLSVQTPQPLGVGYNVQRSSLQRVVQDEEHISETVDDVIEISCTDSSGEEEHDSEPRAVEMENSEETHTDTEMGGSSGEESESDDDLNDLQVNEYKDLSYKFFQYQTHKLRGSNGEFRCPFCAYYEEEGLCSYTRLLLHANRVAEISKSGKPKANHFAMARYLAIDLADELKAEAEQLSRSKEGKRLDKGGDEAQTERKRPRLDEDCTKKEELEKVRQLERELNEKTDQMNDLIAKERLSNDELQGARRELIKGLNDVLKGNHVQIGIKNVGEIDSKVVIKELEKIFSPVYAAMKGVELCSLWQEKLKNTQRLLKEDDELLQGLKKEWGQVIHNAVVVAMNDLHQYNPGGCNVVPELWNFKQNRKAALDEVICYILDAVKDVVKMGNTSNINNSRISNSDEEFGIKESKIYELKEKAYKKLKSRAYKLRGRCPFCSVVEEQEYTSPLRHALMMAESSSESTEQRANHFALAKYLVIDLSDDAEPSPQCTRSLPTSRKTLERNTPGEYVQQEEYKKTKKEVPEKLLNAKKVVARVSG